MRGKDFIRKSRLPGSGSIARIGGGGWIRGGITDGTFGIATGMATVRGACGAGFFRGLFCCPRELIPDPAWGDKPSSVLEV